MGADLSPPLPSPPNQAKNPFNLETWCYFPYAPCCPICCPLLPHMPLVHLRPGTNILVEDAETNSTSKPHNQFGEKKTHYKICHFFQTKPFSDFFFVGCFTYVLLMMTNPFCSITCTSLAESGVLPDFFFSEAKETWSPKNGIKHIIICNMNKTSM